VGFRLKKNESASAGVRRIAREEIDDALALLEKKGADPAETVHELRKRLKKIRAVVRLVREELGEEVFRRDNRTLRDLGRTLSPARDAAVRVSALERLKEEYPDEYPDGDMAELRKRFAARHRDAVRRLRRGSALSSLAGELRRLRRRVRAWPLSREGFPCLEAGLRRSFKDGRDGETEAYRSRTDEAFHEWRKRAKGLRYHVELLQPVWPRVMDDVEKALHELTDHLGDDHDLGELSRALRASSEPSRGKKSTRRVLDLIGRRRSELQAKARPAGARIYSEKPRVFATRMESYWDAWRS
jgi:CHAD domain-containing protein